MNPSSLLCLLNLCLFASLGMAAPDRMRFAMEDRPIEGVPVEAFELIDENLTIELWARSPLIYSPVAMDFDAQGRLWLTEGIDYQRGLRIEEGRSIMVLEDQDGDGEADSSHVFVTEKEIRHAPLGIAVFDNRIVLSATPSIIVYTDVDRDAVFDPKIDRREVFLDGFQNKNHDHSVHGVVGGPSGQWHFSFGNCGADLTTKDGKRFVAASYYGYPEAIGSKSSDGEVYVGGMSMRINPDGTGLTPTGENMRNSHDMFVTSQGDLLQSDNDDPAHARISWVMEGANMGYADLTDGSRSWEEVAKTWEEPAGWSKSRRFSRSHWRENYPGAFPPGNVYGAGSPTGNVYIEDNALGLAGTYLVACMVRKEVMACLPQWKDGYLEMGKQKPLIRLKEDHKSEFFLPTDLALAPDGSLFLADFYNDTSRGTNQVSGSIYRISRKDGALLKFPEVDFNSVDGLLSALESPAVNVRSHAASQLVKKGQGAVEAVLAFLKENEEDPALSSRAMWVLAQLGEDGRKVVESHLDDGKGEQAHVVAYRALRLADPISLLERAAESAASKFLSVRREVALSLKPFPFEDCLEILSELIDSYDGSNRYYLEALGIAFSGKEAEVFRELVSLKHPVPAIWSAKAKNLAWRLHTPEAIRALDICLRAQRPPVDEFRRLAMAFASFRNQEERLDRITRLRALGKLPDFKARYYQQTIEEIIRKDLNDLQGELMESSYLVPQVFGAVSEVSKPSEIALLQGDPAAGKLVAAKCYLCHKIEGVGVGFGPDLTHWGKERTIEEIVREIVYPDEKLAHGYEKPVRLVSKKTGQTAEGFLSNYSWHAGSLKLKIMGGETRKILFRRAGAKVEYLNESWMPSAAEMGMSDQDLVDLAVYLQTTGSEAPPATPHLDEPVPPIGNEPGWQVLTGNDFLNVNCMEDTWRWELGHAYCTGKPTGVIRFREPLRDFELLLEWKHKKKGGNSGVFVWATPNSIAKLAAGHGRLPHGIEVQVLDLGYAELYEKAYQKPSDWFTSHGDVFPVGPVKMRPFPPVAPNGKRSFPSQETTLGINHWNHYYVRAVGGEVRLWVNGVEVSGGDGISPASGYLCLESEGAPIEFRNLRLRRLSEMEDEMKLPTYEPAAAVALKGHPALGTWAYLNGYTREVKEDGYVTLCLGNNLIWKRRCVSKSENEFVLEGNLVHKLIGEILHIEGKYQALRQ